jgi:hypothetical protein
MANETKQNETQAQEQPKPSKYNGSGDITLTVPEAIAQLLFRVYVARNAADIAVTGDSKMPYQFAVDVLNTFATNDIKQRKARIRDKAIIKANELMAKGIDRKQAYAAVGLTVAEDKLETVTAVNHVPAK